MEVASTMFGDPIGRLLAVLFAALIFVVAIDVWLVWGAEPAPKAVSSEEQLARAIATLNAGAPVLAIAPVSGGGGAAAGAAQPTVTATSSASGSVPPTFPPLDLNVVPTQRPTSVVQPVLQAPLTPTVFSGAGALPELATPTAPLAVPTSAGFSPTQPSPPSGSPAAGRSPTPARSPSPQRSPTQPPSLTRTPQPSPTLTTATTPTAPPTTPPTVQLPTSTPTTTAPTSVVPTSTVTPGGE